MRCLVDQRDSRDWERVQAPVQEVAGKLVEGHIVVEKTVDYTAVGQLVEEVVYRQGLLDSLLAKQALQQSLGRDFDTRRI